MLCSHRQFWKRDTYLSLPLDENFFTEPTSPKPVRVRRATLSRQRHKELQAAKRVGVVSDSSTLSRQPLPLTKITLDKRFTSTKPIAVT
ncbi:hypothetical protein RRG08_043480 [Elysia crispata]|uniref:Uncharacterized protein n=1 Tax=Elysia crispata TaxID=231223 RepID=A0AAE0YFQ7_9GAST|nr:hypothetical protein RRG08_043480 [Elysia crispata]